MILRKFNISDSIAVFHNWTGDEKLDFYQWAIVLKEINEPIGTISVVELDEKTEKVHIGYCIGSKWWHLGYTSEALAAIIPFFFEQVGVNRIESQHDPENANSGKVMKKCGLVCEGILRQADWSNKGIVDACMHGMLASNYFQNDLLNNLTRVHTTELGEMRIKRNLSLETDDVVEWCKNQIAAPDAKITRNGKNWYVNVDGAIITVNAYSYTIITAHKEK